MEMNCKHPKDLNLNENRSSLYNIFDALETTLIRGMLLSKDQNKSVKEMLYQIQDIMWSK